MNIQEINEAIKGVDTNLISDGYHTFGELYDHRIALYIALCRAVANEYNVWRSTTHSDGSSWDGWFVLGISKMPGRQVTYHLPTSEWNKCDFAVTLDKAPDFDGHTPSDVIKRIGRL